MDNKIINGTDVLLKIDGMLVACATSHSVELTNSTRDTSSKCSGESTDSEYGRFSWTVSTDALLNLGMSSDLYVSYAQLMQWMLNKSIVSIESVYVEDTEAFAVLGDTIITSISKTAGDNENASYSVSLQGHGDLSIQEGLILTAIDDLATGIMTASTAPLTWTDANTSPNETGILVEYSKEDEDWDTFSTEDADSVSVTVTGLDASTNYRFRVTALGSGIIVNSPFSNIVSDTTTA